MLAYAAGMLAAWISMRLFVLHLYGHNPVAAATRLADVKLWQNLGFLVKPQHWPVLPASSGLRCRSSLSTGVISSPVS